MEFLKNHYEKLLLSVVLLALVGASAWLMVKAGKIRSNLEQTTQTITRQQNYPPNLKPRDSYESVIQVTSNPPVPDLTGEHRLLNPVRWVINAEGQMVAIRKAQDFGIENFQIQKIRPLEFTVRYESSSGTPDRPRFKIETTSNSAANDRDRRPKTQFLSLDRASREVPYYSTNVTLTVTSFTGDPLMPDSVSIRLGEEGSEVLTLTSQANYTHTEVQGYEVDMIYPVENKTYSAMREGSYVIVDGEAYIIIAIRANQVVFVPRGKSNRITLTQNAPSAP